MATVGAVYCRNPALLDYEASMLVIGLVDGGFIKTLSKICTFRVVKLWLKNLKVSVS
jgi:hypothetical protein